MNKSIDIQPFVCEVSKCPDIQRLKAENEGLKSQLDFEIQKRETVEQTLEAVREITKKYYLSDKKLLATGIMINPYNAIIEIQDKINEVLKDET